MNGKVSQEDDCAPNRRWLLRWKSHAQSRMCFDSNLSLTSVFLNRKSEEEGKGISKACGICYGLKSIMSVDEEEEVK